MTASTALDPMPLPTYLRGDDISVEACTTRRRNDMHLKACLPSLLEELRQQPQTFIVHHPCLNLCLGMQHVAET